VLISPPNAALEGDGFLELSGARLLTNTLAYNGSPSDIYFLLYVFCCRRWI